MTDSLPQRNHLTRIPVWLPLDKPVVYFVTACCAGRRDIFNAPQPVRIAVECLQRAGQRLGWEVMLVCVMPDHVHFLLSPQQDREQSLSNFVQRWKSCVTLRMKGLVDGPLWQREFFDRLLRSDEKLEEKWEYVRHNPVRKNLCADPEHYPYSGTTEEILRKLSAM